MNILVTYSTNSGSTEEVAQAIADELGQQGEQVTLRRLDEVSTLDPFDAVVVGGPMILGWHRAARQFVHQHRQALSQKRVAFFFTAISLTQTGERSFNGVPISVDAETAKPPHNARRLSLRERYATPANYLRPVLRAAPGVHPLSVGFFGGKLEMFRLKLLQMLFVMLVIQAQPGDYRNWPFIRAWAAQLRTQLEGQPAVQVVTA
jgi:menaquinone-dependent protoporphyrinogen oxidase